MSIAIDRLREWCVHDIRIRDTIHRKVESIVEEDDRLIVTRSDRDKKVLYLILPTLEDLGFMNKLAEYSVTLVCLNNKPNIDFMLKQWKILSEEKEVTIVFANPQSHTDKRWIINPYIHTKFCDMDSLSLGIYTLAEGVEFIEENEIITNI